MARKKRQKRKPYPEMKHPEIQVFELKTTNEEIRNEFNDFFYKYNLMDLFTNEHKSTPISVSDSEARSLINAGGSYNRTLLEFADLLNIDGNSKSFEEAKFKLLFESRSFQGFINNIKRIMAVYMTLDNKEEHKFWNIVFYNKEVIH